MPTTSVPGVIVIEEAIAMISRSVVARSGYSTIAGELRVRGLYTPAATAKEPFTISPRIHST